MKIGFSHDYEKFTGKKLPFEATLLQCFLIDREDISPQFEYYDTLYVEGGRGDMYPLPKGKLIVLLLWDMEDLFTTIRRYTPEKWEYYKKHEGEDFEIVRT